MGKKFADDEKYRDDDDEAQLVRVFVDPTRKEKKVSPWLFGTNLSPAMETETGVVKFIRQSGITCFRFPDGGSPGYHWKDGSFDHTGRFARAPLRDMDYFIQFCRTTGTRPIIRVNVESGTPAEAAAWVAYLNKTAVFPATYWELGNEVYDESDRGYRTPEKYADLIIAYSTEMKKADPSIKIGMDWAPTAKHSFNAKVVVKAGKYVDFVSVHWYPNLISPDRPWNGRIHPYPEEVLAGSLQIKGMVEEIREIFKKYDPERAKPVEVAFLEWEGTVDGPALDLPPYSKGIVQWSLANALFHADCLGIFAKEGVDVAATFDFQSTGSGYIRGSDKDVDETGQRWDNAIIRPKALALKLFSEYFGDTVVACSVADAPYYYAKEDWWPETYRGRVPYVTAYAGLFEGKDKLTLMLINKHPEKSYAVHALTYNVALWPKGKVYVLTGPALTAQNEDNPSNVQIKEFEVDNIAREMDFSLPPHAVMLIQMDIENENNK